MSNHFYGTPGPSISKAVFVTNYSGGGLYIDDTAAHAFNGSGILALSAAVASSITTTNPNGVQGTLTTVPLPVGVVVPIPFSSITLSSGKVIALA